MADRLAGFRPPALDPSEARQFGLYDPHLVNDGGGQEVWHFWFFPLLTVPFVWAVKAAGASILRAFFLFNADVERRTTIRICIVASMLWSVVAFRPSVEESYLEPSRLALTVWTTHPAWDNPPAEIFAERIRHRDGTHTLAATAGCEKALITAGQWPAGCDASTGLPPVCASGMCYANRRSDGAFDYVATARRPGYRLPWRSR